MKNQFFKDRDRMIFIVQRVNSTSQIICDCETGECEEVECQDYEPMKLYTKEEVEELLEKQRILCYRFAKIEKSEYINSYSESDGEITTKVSKKSILDVILELR